MHKTFYERVRISINDGSFFEKVFYRFSLLYFKFFAVFYAVQQKKVVCQNFLGRGYADNPKYVIEELHRKYPDWEIVWLSKSSLSSQSHYPDFVRVVEFFSFAALKELATASVWIDNVRGCSLRVPKKNKQIYIQLWHGTLPVKKIEKDAEKNLDSHYLKLAKKDSLNTDVCVSGCSFMTKIFKESFWYNGEILEAGTPRNDILFSKEKQLEIRESLGVEKTQKICIYAPTFRTGEHAFNYDIDYPLLKKALEEKFGFEWIVLLRLHPNVILDKTKSLPAFVKNVSLYPDVQEILSVTDCLISDFSSIMFEFMQTKNPVFIYAQDFEEYIKNERGLYFSLSETPFPISKSNSELEQSILSFDNKLYLEQLENFKKKFTFFDDGHASEHVVQWMMQKLEKKEI